MLDEVNPAQSIDREQVDYQIAKQRYTLAETLKTPPSTAKTGGGRRIGAATNFNSNTNAIPKRPHSGLNPKQRENSNGPAPNAKQMRTKIDQLESALSILQK